MPDNRNRSAIAREKGGRLLAVEVSGEALGHLATVQAGLAGRAASAGLRAKCTQAQAVEFALREVAKKFPKKTVDSA